MIFLKNRKNYGVSLIEFMVGLSLGIVCITMMLKLFAGSLSHNENIKEEMSFNNPAEFQRQVRDELEGSGFQLTMNLLSNPRLFMCNIIFNDKDQIQCKKPEPTDKNFCIISSKERADTDEQGTKTNIVITGFRLKPGTEAVLEKFKRIVPDTNPLAKKPEKEICEDSDSWNELHQSKSMSINAFKICLANIGNPADVSLANSPPTLCNLGGLINKNGDYDIISNTNHFIWMYIDTKFHNNNDTSIPLKFLVYIRNKPDIVVPEL